MANALTEKGRQNFLEADIDWLVSQIDVMLGDMNTQDTSVNQVEGATNATPIVITSTAHGFSNGDLVAITGVGGNTAANGNFAISSVAANTFELDGSVGNGAYTSGGLFWRRSASEFIDAYSAARLDTDQTITTPTSLDGVANGDNLTYTAVAGGANANLLMIYQHDAGGEGAEETICGIDTATGMPVATNGGDITVTWNASGIFKI
jgi:hypothetical protein